MSAGRGAWCAAITIAVLLTVSPPDAPANYCGPDYRVAEWRPASAEPAQEGVSPAWWVITASVGVIGWLMGQGMQKPLPTMDQVAAAIDAVFKVRADEADIHSKPKLSKPLDAARKASIAAMKKLLYP